MALRLRTILVAVLCTEVLSDQEVENDVSLLQKSLRFDGEIEHPHRGMELLQRHQKGAGPPEVFVDLDAVPEQRWSNVTRYYADLGVYPQYLQAHKEDFNFAERAALDAWQLDEEYMGELRGIMAPFKDELVDPEATLDRLKLKQIHYELHGGSEAIQGIAAAAERFAHQMLAPEGCSGLLAAMPNGTVVHGRNMDWYGFAVEVNGKPMYYPEVTIEVTFLRSGKPLMTSIHWPMSIGIHTAIRHGGWSFEQNLRHHGMDASLLYAITRESQGYMIEARKIMETVPDFETAITKLYGINLMAPGYFIVAGTEPYQGAVITMDRGGTHAATTPPVMRLSRDMPVFRDGQNYTGNWHIFQTNDDQGKPALDLRRPTAEIRLSESTQDMVSTDWVFSQLSQPPVYNNLTIFTTAFVPSTGYRSTHIYFGHTR